MVVFDALKDSNVHFDKITFSQPIKHGDKYFIRAKYEEDKVLIKYNSWGTNVKDLMNEGDLSTSMEIFLKGGENVNQLVEFLIDLEEGMIKRAKEDKDIWFPEKGLTDEYLDDSFQSTIKMAKKTKDATIKLRTSKDMVAYDSKKEEVTLDNIVQDTTIGVIMAMDGVWFSKNKFGLTLKVVQVRIKKEKESRKCMFDENDEEEQENVYPDDV